MKIVCLSDCHSMLDFSLPEADLLLIAGDLCPAYHDPYLSIDLQKDWLNNEFKKWLNKQPIKYCISIFGNHDWIGEAAPNEIPIWIPKNHKDIEMVPNTKIEYIEDYLTFYNGLKIYGTPVVPSYNKWAFNKEEGSLQKYWDNIPVNLDILLCHCPPYGIMDKNEKGINIGSESLLKRIYEIKPKCMIFGHNHADYGIKNMNGITFVNCSLCISINNSYKRTKEPIFLEI